MTGMLQRRDLVIGVTPLHEPNGRLAAAVERAGGLGVVSLGLDAQRARSALADAVRWSRGTFGVFVPAGCPLDPAHLPDEVDTVILGLGSGWSIEAAAGQEGRTRRVLVEVSDVTAARRATDTGADGLIAKGSEAGGRVGDTTAFVLLQQLLAETDLPVWSAGGIGLHTAAAAVAGGAAGVVLDAQLALSREAELGSDVAAAVASMDGSETTVVEGHRVFTRPDLPVATDVAARLGGRDLRTLFVPVGQEGAFAQPLADRYVTAGGIVAAVRHSITDHLAIAAATRPLAARSHLAASRGLTYPVAQGPMTRVSDRAAFALAVAEAGGLPFLALSLMSGDEVRSLLEETAARLGSLTWGVGILGFVPAELRETQLAVVHDVRPPCALIAGGRPSQAAPLEAAGIDTFLHVPSPGLLDRFLRDGARKFVFEGRECGGHVGPRSSFALWDAQIERLLAFGAEAANKSYFGDLHVLFAGGIHDERSAAMAAAAAAPLAERGAGVGVLMGTAYLFTTEAVATGAIVPGFQQAAIGCQSTVLLETSPGHATRCVESDYVQAFRDTKGRLEQAGATQQETWAELEQLNLGRLRLASKGLRRQAGSLVAIGENEQRLEGMVMIGEVATLRSTTTTVAALHAQVSDGATAFVSARAADLGVAVPPAAAAEASRTAVDGSGLTVQAVRENGRPLDIAIVGMACVFPAASDTDAYWSNVVAGTDAVTEVPADRWDVETYYDPDAVTTGAGRRTPSKWGGFLPEIGFDALSYGIPPSSLVGIDPSQLLALEVAARALADAGYARRTFDRERTSVIFGAEAGTDLAGAYGFRALHQTYVGDLPEELDEHLPKLNEDSFPGVLSNVISGRIANRLDLGGANYTVDAACASSLAALDLACKELAAGTSDMVLCGGADVHNGIQDFLLFASVHALSPTGHCRTFDAKADGIALGEGVACIVLKRLADAEADGDRIYSVVKAIAGSSDGRSLGLTAPRPEGQRRALERAYRSAGISPAEVGMIEAHGTGTVVGDRTELATLTEVFAEAGAAAGSCALGSVKSQIGHTKCAAGLAGLIKVANALYRGVRAPTGQLSEPNPYWDGEASPFFFDSTARPWAASPAGRYAGVSAFGFGGTNFHAVLAAYDGAPEPAHGLDEWPAELFLFRGADAAVAGQQIAQLSQLLRANDAAGRPWKLRDLAATASAASLGGAPVQVAVVADDLDDLAAKLERASVSIPSAGIFARGSTTGELAFLFPGQGSQSPGMLADLFVAFPRLRRFLGLGTPALAATMFPPAAFSTDDADRQRAAITDTRVAQPTLGIAGLAMDDLLRTVGVVPDLAGGHSYGELVALATTGALDPADLIDLSVARGEAILAAAGADAGTMAAVSAPLDQVVPHLAGGVVVANHNAPTQVVISGPTAAVESTVARLRAQGLSAKRIPVACAFHSPVVSAAAGTLSAELVTRHVRPSSIPVWSNTTASPYPAEPDAVRDTLAGQVAAPVRFVEQVEAMYAAGARVFVEAGPGRVLTGLVDKILGDRPHVAVACDVAGESGLRRLLLALAELAAAGVAVDTEPLYQGRHTRRATTAGMPRRPGWLVNGHLVRTADGQLLPGGLRPANTLTRRPAAVVAAAPSERDATVLEFLRNTRELVAAQRDVLLGYLGTSGESLPAPGSIPAFGEGAGVARPEIVIPAPALNGGPVRSGPRGLAGAGGQPGAAGPAGHHGLAGALAGAGASGPGAPFTRVQVLDAVLAIVGDRTGYPLDMLDPDLDLEADLSIDSIKRTEILAELAERVGLAGAGGGAIDESMVEELARLKTLNAIADWIVAHADPATPAAPDDPFTRAQVLDAVLAIVGDRTGYPLDMLDPDLDLEADLSIDSIKRTEILAELAERVGLAGADGGAVDESMVEELARLKTLNAIADWIVAHANPEAATATEPAPAPDDGNGLPRRTRRHVLELEPIGLLPAESGDPDGFAGRRYLVIDGGLGIGLELAELLELAGAEVRILAADQTGLDEHLGALDGADGLIHLAAVDPDQSPALPEAFALFREAVERGVQRLVVVSGAGGRFGHDCDAETSGRLNGGLGLAGLIRTVRAEYPRIVSQLIDVDAKERPGIIARVIASELAASNSPAVVGYARDGSRSALRVVPAELERRQSTPAAEIAEAAAAIGLGPDSVVLLTGGARGITSKVAIELARASGCHIELLGRTQPPTGAEDPATAGAADAAAIRRALIATGVRVPHQIEVATARILARREIGATLAELNSAASSARYHEVDVRDGVAVRAVVEGIYARHGRIDGVIHGAGVLEDKRMSDKNTESFNRVYRTKVDGARNLADALRSDLGFMVLFGSISGVFGNRGQVDYSSANDALDSLARMWSGRFGGRVVAVDWGPWASLTSGAGMVSAELEREYARRGVGMIGVDDGIACLLRELAWGSDDDPQVVYMRNAADSSDPFGHGHGRG